MILSVFMSHRLLLLVSFFMVMIGIFGLSACSWEYSGNNNLNPPTYFFTEAKNGFEVFYDSRATKSIKEYYESGSIVINGSYFGATASGLYYPAWLWEDAQHACCSLFLDDGTPISTAPNYEDPNLSYIVWVSGKGEVKMFPRQLFKENAWPYAYSFQAWPLVLSENLPQSSSGSWHADEPHERTLIGKTKSGKIYFFTFIHPFSLSEVWKVVYSSFRDDPITLLNLDGWPSTAYYDGQYWFNEDAKLPIIIRIKL